MASHWDFRRKQQTLSSLLGVTILVTDPPINPAVFTYSSREKHRPSECYAWDTGEGQTGGQWVPGLLHSFLLDLVHVSFVTNSGGSCTR